MLLEGKNWNKFMVSIAMACTMRKRENTALDTEEAAAFVGDVLQIALSPSGRSVHVEAIPYLVTSKVPLKVIVDNGLPRLFWYYPVHSEEDLSEDLAEMIAELSDATTALATA